MQNLYYMYNKHDVFLINFNKIMNKDFKINYKDSNKIFNSYLFRFTTTIVLLNFLEEQKIIYFSRIFFNKL